MGMIFVGATQSSIQEAALNSGLVLTADQVRDIAEAERACLAESGRVSFGESAAARIARDFAVSPFISRDCAAEVFVRLTEVFYELRNDFPASTTDADIIESLGEAFNGEAAGDAGLAAVLARETLTTQLDYSTYEIADDDGNVYRWDPEEWHDDVTAKGWCGEKWEDADE